MLNIQYSVTHTVVHLTGVVGKEENNETIYQIMHEPMLMMYINQIWDLTETPQSSPHIKLIFPHKNNHSKIMIRLDIKWFDSSPAYSCVEEDESVLSFRWNDNVIDFCIFVGQENMCYHSVVYTFLYLLLLKTKKPNKSY